MKTREQITPAVEWREESTRCRTVHWSFRASGWPKSSKLIGFQSCPFTSNWKTFLVIRQINHTSLMHPLSIHLPHPSSLPFLSSHSPPPFISSFTVFFRLSATDQEGKGRKGRGGGRNSRETFETVLTDCLTHRRIKDGLPGCPPPRATFLWNLHLFSPTDRCEPWNLARGRMEPRSTWRAKTKATPSWRETIKLAKP